MKVSVIEVPATVALWDNHRREPSGVIVLFRCRDWGTWEIDQQLPVNEQCIPAMVQEIVRKHPNAAEFRVIRFGEAVA